MALIEECEWRIEKSIYITGCGVRTSYNFEYKGYVHFYKYCPHCGRKLKVKLYE